MNEELEPTINSLKAEKERYLQWSSLTEEVDRTEKKAIKYSYIRDLTRLEQMKLSLKITEDAQAEAEKTKREAENQIIKSKQKIGKLNEEFQRSGIDKLREDVGELNKKKACAETQYSENTKNRKLLATSIDEIKSKENDVRIEITNLLKTNEGGQQEEEKLATRLEQSNTKVFAMQKEHEALVTGLTSTSDGQSTLGGLLMQTENQLLQHKAILCKIDMNRNEWKKKKKKKKKYSALI
eukprot:Trichotokara_eunicae@DN4511_c0_g1_i2.p1